MKKRFLATLMVATMAFAMVGCSTDGAARVVGIPHRQHRQRNSIRILRKTA